MGVREVAKMGERAEGPRKSKQKTLRRLQAREQASSKSLTSLGHPRMLSRRPLRLRLETLDPRARCAHQDVDISMPRIRVSPEPVLSAPVAVSESRPEWIDVCLV